MPHIDDGGNRRLPIRLRRDFIASQFASLDALISPSRYLSDAYGRTGVPAAIRRVIEYGIDVSRYSQVTKSARVGPVRFTFIGYLGPHKGVPLLIDAARILRKSSVIINLVGDGELMQSLRQRVEKEALSGTVRFLGKLNNQSIEQVYRETDALVLPSIWPENQPVTILEAMASRTAVLASRIGGIPEMVVDGVTGYLFEPGNALDLANRMSELVAHPERIEKFGAAGFAKIQRHTYENSIRSILAVYHEIRNTNSDAVADSKAVISCAGGQFNEAAVEAMDWIDRSRQHDSWRFTMNDWPAAPGRGKSKVLWVVDDRLAEDSVHSALQSWIPLVVPEHHVQLKDLCRRENCGLYYRNAAEAYECLNYLLENDAVSAALGRNGFAYWTRSLTGRSGHGGRNSAQGVGF
jgi:hypothetical protein